MYTPIRTTIYMIMALCLFVLVPTFASMAQEEETRTPQHYTLLAGMEGLDNIYLGFAPHTVQVHRGDTVTWLIMGPHNVHFTDGGWLPLVVTPEVDGQPTPILNPEIIIPTIESGGTYTGGEVNLGLLMGGDSLGVTLTFDVEPGTYRYLCDVHVGMAGLIEVVEDDVEIATPVQVLEQAFGEYFNSSMAAQGEVETVHAGHNHDEASTSVNVQVGVSEGGVFITNYLPNVVAIKVGDTVTWTVPADNIELVSVTSSDLIDGGIMPLFINGEDAPPALGLTPSWDRLTEDGAEIRAGDSFNSGVLQNGETYSLTFVEPGVYSYGNNMGFMAGAVVVLPN